MSVKIKLILPDREEAPEPVIPTLFVVDVGSNNVRINGYGPNKAGLLRKAKLSGQTSFPAGLAIGMHTDGGAVIRPENLAIAVKAMSVFDAIIASYNVAPENILTVMTEAIRTVEKTPQGREDIKTLSHAFGKRPLWIATKEEEAILNGIAVRLSRLAPGGKKVFAAIGGGSIQIGHINADGDILKPVSLPYGVHKLIKASGGNIKDAGTRLEEALRKEYPDHQHNNLCLMGSYWRALGETICQRPVPIGMKGENDIRQAMLAATLCTIDHYKVFVRSKDITEVMPMVAAMGRRVADHFGAKKVYFLETTMRDAMAHCLHMRNNREPIPPGLERLFSPSAPAQAYRA